MKFPLAIAICYDNEEESQLPGSRNCAAQQRALQIILDIADKSSKRNIIILLHI